MWTSSSALLRLPLALLLLATFTLAAFSLGGCKQDEGDRCQLNSDCSDGLICCFSVNPPPDEQRYLGGTCTSANQCSTVQPDLGELDDSGPQIEAGTDSTPTDGITDSTIDSMPTDSTIDSTPIDITIDSTPIDSIPVDSVI